MFLTAIAATAFAEVCKWVDEQGCVHFAETCPEGVDGQVMELDEAECADELAREPDSAGARGEDESVPVAFEPVSRIGQLRGCWKRQPRPPNALPDRIALYPFEEPEHQYFCFASAGKLYTLFTSKALEGPVARQERQIRMLPAAESYEIPRRGVVRIHHRDNPSPMQWVTSVVHRKSEAGWPELREGDLFMTVRHPETGEDLYFRHLRRME